MIYIFTALYCEASVLIRRFQLVKNQQITWFQEFYNETAGIRLAVTGVGEIAAAAVVSSMCTMYGPDKGDLLLNVGICAHTTGNNGIFLCNKIVELATGKTYFPDMLYRHDFSEGTILTGMRLWNAGNTENAGSTEPGMRLWNAGDTGTAETEVQSGEAKTKKHLWNAEESGGYLYDMEAAAVYQAGIHFFGPHQMSFLKIVSDSGVLSEVSQEQTLHLMEQYQDSIADYIGKMAALIQENCCHKYQNREDEKLIETFCTDLHCSRTMRASVEQYIRYLALSGIDYACVIQEFYDKKQLPCRDKREGKRYFDEFRRRLF